MRLVDRFFLAMRVTIVAGICPNALACSLLLCYNETVRRGNERNGAQGGHFGMIRELTPHEADGETRGRSNRWPARRLNGRGAGCGLACSIAAVVARTRKEGPWPR